jgi:hypothetical protein
MISSHLPDLCGTAAKVFFVELGEAQCRNHLMSIRQFVVLSGCGRPKLSGGSSISANSALPKRKEYETANQNRNVQGHM